MTSGKYLLEKSQTKSVKFSISKNSAFKPWKQLDINGYTVFSELVETNQITLCRKNKILTPFEGVLWLESLHIKMDNGVIKITSNLKG